MTAVDELVDIDLEAWLNNEIEKPCELWITKLRRKCDGIAEYFCYMVAIEKECDMYPRRISRYICKECKLAIEVSRVYCSRSAHVLKVTYIERIK